MARQLRRPHGMAGGKVGKIMNRANEFLYDFTLNVMRPSDNESILEIGFGNGKFFEKLFSTAANLHITGLDFSATMLKAATLNNKERIAKGKLQLQFGSSDHLPFPANSFDKIFCINVIYFWDQPQQHLQEIKRVLKPGGHFYATVRTKESMLKMPFTKYGFNYYEREKWKTLLEETGLTLVEEKLIDEQLTGPVIGGVDINKTAFQSLCVVAEKKYRDG